MYLERSVNNYSTWVEVFQCARGPPQSKIDILPDVQMMFGGKYPPVLTGHIFTMIQGKNVPSMDRDSSRFQWEHVAQGSQSAAVAFTRQCLAYGWPQGRWKTAHCELTKANSRNRGRALDLLSGLVICHPCDEPGKQLRSLISGAMFAVDCTCQSVARRNQGHACN